MTGTTRPSFPTVSEICSQLDSFAPLRLAESWDNTGLLLGHAHVPVQKMLTCLTLTEQVAWEAVGTEAQLVITHHPVFFRPPRKLTDATDEGRMVLVLAEHRIAVYCPHTAFDSAVAGINQQLAESLGLESISPLRPLATDPSLGAGRWGVFREAVPRPEFLRRVQHVTRAAWLEWSAAGPERIQRVAVGCGAGGEFLADAARLQCDTFVTGESRFHGILEAQALGLNLVLAGHYESERPGVEDLARRLREWFPQVQTAASAAEQNPLRLYTHQELRNV
ncbi:MAG: Nif3-like dinuclear metal center hexameric protein [Planctomycetota bacterium]